MATFGVLVSDDIGGPDFYQRSGTTPKAGVIVIAEDTEGNKHYLLHHNNDAQKLKATVSSPIQRKNQSTDTLESWFEGALRAANQGLFCTSPSALKDIDPELIPKLRYYFDEAGDAQPLSTLSHVSAEHIEHESGHLYFSYYPGESACASYVLRLQGTYSAEQLISFAESLSYISEQRKAAYDSLRLDSKAKAKPELMPYLSISAFSEHKTFSFFPEKEIIAAIYKYVDEGVSACLTFGTKHLPLSQDDVYALEKIPTLHQVLEARRADIRLEPKASALTKALNLGFDASAAAGAGAGAVYHTNKTANKP